MDLEQRLREILPKSQHDKIDLIMDACAQEIEISAVFDDRARVTVETVEIYGLCIEVDANGNAGRVHFDPPVYIEAY